MATPEAPTPLPSATSPSQRSRAEIDRLVEDHIGLVYSVALRLFRRLGSRVELDELVSLGTIGLIQAAQRFDEDGGASFGTFAYYRVRGAMYDGIAAVAPLPRWAYRSRVAALRALERAENDDDALDEISDATRCAASLFVRSIGSLDDTPCDAERGPRAPDEAVATSEMCVAVREALDELPARDAALMRRHYWDDVTLLDAGRELGISKSWASRVHARSLKALRHKLDEAA